MIDFEHGKFSPKALDFLAHSDARLNILHGSVRSTKTVNCTLRWITYCLDGPPGDLMMVGKTVATLQRNVLNDLQDILGVKYFKWVNRQQGELQILGRRVHAVGANSEDAEARIRGATLAGALCDEANLYPQSFWNQLMARCSVKGAMIFANCNPDSPFHWFYTEVIKNEKITNKKVWHFVLEDNPNLSEEYVESLKSMYTGVFYKRFIEGLWVVADGMIYDMFTEERHVKKLPIEKLKSPANDYYIACDYGTSTTMSWSFLVRFPDGSYHKMSEYYYDAIKRKKQQSDSEFGNDFDAWITQNITKLGYTYRTCVRAIFVDPSAASWKMELRNRGYIVKDANNDVINGIRCVAALLAQDKYTIDPDCVNTIAEYASYSWDPTYQQKGLDKPIKEKDHACDSDRYGIYSSSQTALTGTYSAR